MRKLGIGIAVMLLAMLVMQHPRNAAAQQGPTYIPLMLWPLPDDYRWIIAFPDEGYTWWLLGLAPGKTCPPQLKREFEPSKPYWRDPEIGEGSDWAQASRGTNRVDCYWHHAGTDIFVAPGTPVYAVADGTIITVANKPNEDDEMNGYVEIEHNRVFRGVRYTWQARYLHLQLNPPVTTGPVAEGTLIGYVIYRKNNTHLHYEVNNIPEDCQQYHCISNPWGNVSLWIDYDDDARIDPATNGLDVPLNGLNLVNNSGFDAGTEDWASSPGAKVEARDGTLIASRIRGKGLAWIKQVLAYKFAEGTPIEARLKLGNSSSANKYVGISLHDPETWRGAITCLFAIPPNTPPQYYSVQGIVPAEWRNAILHITLNPADSAQGVVLDEITLKRSDDIAPAATRCIAEH